MPSSVHELELSRLCFTFCVIPDHRKMKVLSFSTQNCSHSIVSVFVIAYVPIKSPGKLCICIIRMFTNRIKVSPIFVISMLNKKRNERCGFQHLSRRYNLDCVGPVILFSKINNTFLGCFDPVNLTCHNK